MKSNSFTKTFSVRKLQAQMALLGNFIKHSKMKYQNLVQTLSEIKRGSTSQLIA